MHDVSTERRAFADYAKRLFQDVQKHKDHDVIEIETVFPRYTPNVAISVFLKNREQMVFCGHPTVEKLEDGNFLFVPSVKCALADGIEVFGMVEPNNLGESVQYTSTKVYVALVNDKAGEVYHLFPSLSTAHRRAFVDNMCKAYSALTKTTEEMVPNYILKSVRSAGVNPQTAGPSAFRNVVNQLVQKAWDKEQLQVQSQLHAHHFGSSEFESIYKRFKYLSGQSGSGVTALRKSLAVDITVLRSGDSENNTRISLHGKKCFDAYCQHYKALDKTNDIVAFVTGLPADECAIIQKREMHHKELKVLRDTVCYNGFKFNAKREDNIPSSKLTDTLKAFFADGVHHSYRYKRRYSFQCEGFNVDLTIVRKGDDRHPVFKPTPFVALEQIRRDTDSYEFEIECASPHAANATQCFRWMDECIRAMRKDSFFFGQHVRSELYPMLMDTVQTSAVVSRFNACACHGDVSVKRSGSCVNDGVGPNVVNITHERYQYLLHHFNDYNILMKTDGLRCLAFVEGKKQQMHLFVQKATYPMTVKLQETTADYVLDGELYTHQGKSTYFIFDVYQKNTQQLLTKPLAERMLALTEDIRVQDVGLLVRKKVALFLERFQELCTMTDLNAHELDLKDSFECVDETGVKANDDGFILMHTGPLVRDIRAEDEESLVHHHGTKPYIMRLEEFSQGHRSVSYASREQDGAYIFCLKWKPEDECTIDFKVQLMEHDISVSGDRRRARRCSKFNTHSELNQYTILQALCAGRVTTPICPHTLPNRIQPFQPAEAYDYELMEPMAHGVTLMADAESGKVFTQRKELVQDNSIVEMRYDTAQDGQWVPVRLRTDKTEPNTYSVALANWRNIFNPVPRPLSWVPAAGDYEPSVLASYYTMQKQSTATSQLDNIHLLLKQHLLLRTTKVWATMEPRSKLSVLEVGCGKGTDLFHWNYVHHNIREMAFFMGTDYDKSGLMRHDGAYYRYLRGVSNHTHTKIQTLDTKYDFSALFAQADATKSLEHCRDHPWNHTDTTNNVSKHKLDYEILRYVLFGKMPENSILGKVFHDGMVHPTYNVVSCQFAMHYFAHEKHAFWKNLNLLLTVDGVFVATVPNGDFISSKLSVSNEYTVSIRDARDTSVSVPWYKYERGATKNSVYFQTPKISRREEPLLFKNALLRAARKHFHVLYLDTFGHYASKHSLPIYKTSCETRGVFHSASIDPQSFHHSFNGKHSALARKVHETRDALQYSQDGHYVVILCKKSGRSAGEVEALRAQFV